MGKKNVKLKPPPPPPLQTRVDKVGIPRLNPYLRLLARFYEPLVLLQLLGQTRGEQTKLPRDANEDQFRRRRLAETLASICDVDKGGSTCTAVAIEENDHSYVVWFAVNSDGKSARAVLDLTLNHLREMERGMQPDDEKLLEQCISYAAPRITKEVKGLQSAIENCLKRLANGTKDIDLSEWLASLKKTIADENHLDICTTMARETGAPCMERLQRFIKRDEKSVTSTSKRSEFAIARHFIGRLAYRIRAHKHLLGDGVKLAYLISNFQVRQVPLIECAPMPSRDAHTNLDGIVNRMLPPGSEDKQAIEMSLHRENKDTDLFSAFAVAYGNCKPIVHAEVQILEHFYRNRLQYLKGDRFIGCSKPACFCCSLYFKYHPARIANATSHQKIWINWGPPLVENFQKNDKKSIEQRDILNKMIAQVREELFDQLLRRTPPAPWHPDSVTAISDRTVELDEIISDDSTSSGMDGNGVRLLGT